MRLMVEAMSLKVGNPLRKLVLIKLADNANDDGVCFPSYKYIADVCEISKRSAINHIESLIEMRLISKKSRKNKDGSSSNFYQLHLDKSGESPALGSESPALGSESPALGSESPALGGSESPAPITSHSFEPVNEPKKTTQKKSVIPAEKSETQILNEFGVTGTLAKDFIRHRKALKAVITETVMRGYQREADKLKIPLEAAVTYSIERGWRGFQATWYQRANQTATQSGNGYQDFDFDDTASWDGLTISVKTQGVA